MEGSWPGFWHVCLGTSTHRPTHPSGADVFSLRVPRQLVSVFQILLLCRLEPLCHLAPLGGSSATLSDASRPERSGLCCCFSIVAARLRLLRGGFLKFLRSQVAAVLCILAQAGGRLCDPSSTLAQLREPDLQSEELQRRRVGLMPALG